MTKLGNFALFENSSKKFLADFLKKNVHVSVLVFSFKSKNLNIGCRARFGEIKRANIVIVSSGGKTIMHPCSGKTWVPALQLASA